MDDSGIRRGTNASTRREEASETKTDLRLAPGCSLRSSKEHNKLERFALITPVGQGPNGYRDRLAWILNSRSGEPQSVSKSVTRRREDAWTTIARRDNDANARRIVISIRLCACDVTRPFCSNPDDSMF